MKNLPEYVVRISDMGAIVHPTIRAYWIEEVGCDPFLVAAEIRIGNEKERKNLKHVSTLNKWIDGVSEILSLETRKVLETGMKNLRHLALEHLINIVEDLNELREELESKNNKTVMKLFHSSKNEFIKVHRVLVICGLAEEDTMIYFGGAERKATEKRRFGWIASVERSTTTSIKNYWQERSGIDDPTAIAQLYIRWSKKNESLSSGSRKLLEGFYEWVKTLGRTLSLRPEQVVALEMHDIKWLAEKHLKELAEKEAHTRALLSKKKSSEIKLEHATHDLKRDLKELRRAGMVEKDIDHYRKSVDINVIMKQTEG